MRMNYLAALLLFAATAAMACEDDGDTISARIATAHGTKPLKLELATTPPVREHGLMDRTTLAPNDGMLFVFPDTKPIAFWMKNTRIPLDMLFLDTKGKIVHIAANTTPMSEAHIESTAPTKAVIELAGGRAKAFGIHEGDTVTYTLPADAHVE